MEFMNKCGSWANISIIGKKLKLKSTEINEFELVRWAT